MMRITKVENVLGILCYIGCASLHWIKSSINGLILSLKNGSKGDGGLKADLLLCIAI